MAGAQKNLTWKDNLPIQRRAAVCAGVREKFEKLFPEDANDELHRKTIEFELNIWNRADTWNGYLQDITRELSQLESQVSCFNFARSGASPSPAQNPDCSVQAATFGQLQEMHGGPSAQGGAHMQHQQLSRTPRSTQADRHITQGHQPVFTQDLQMMHQAQIPQTVEQVPHTEAEQRLAELFETFNEQKCQLVGQLLQHAPQQYSIQMHQLLMLQQKQQRELFAQAVAPMQSSMQSQQLWDVEMDGQNNLERQQRQQTAKQSMAASSRNSDFVGKRGLTSPSRVGSSSVARGSRGGRGKTRNVRARRKARNPGNEASLEQWLGLNGIEENAITSEAQSQGSHIARGSRGSSAASPMVHASDPSTGIPLAQHSHSHDVNTPHVTSGIPVAQMNARTAQKQDHGAPHMALATQYIAPKSFLGGASAQTRPGLFNGMLLPAPILHEITEDVWQKLIVMKAKYRAQLHQILPIARAILNGQPQHNRERFRRHLVDCVYLLDMERTSKMSSQLSEAVLSRAEGFICNVIRSASRTLNAANGNTVERDATPQQSQDPRQGNSQLEYASRVDVLGSDENHGLSKCTPRQQDEINILNGSLDLQALSEPQATQQMSPMNNVLEYLHPVQLSAHPQPKVHLSENAVQNDQYDSHHAAFPVDCFRDVEVENVRPPVIPKQRTQHNAKIRHRRNHDPRLRAPHDATRPETAAGAPPVQDVRSSGNHVMQEITPVDNQTFKMVMEPRQGHPAEKSPVPASSLAQSEGRIVENHDIELIPTMQEEVERDSVGREMSGTLSLLISAGSSGTLPRTSPLTALEVLEKKLQQAESSVQQAFDKATRFEDFSERMLIRAKAQRIESVVNALGLPSKSRRNSAGRKRGRDCENRDVLSLASDEQDPPAAKKSKREVSCRKSLKEIIEEDCRIAKEQNPLLSLQLMEQFNHPVVLCQLLFEGIKLPTLVLRVRQGYPMKGRTTVSFELPALGWSGALGEIRTKFERALQTLSDNCASVADVFGEWVRAAGHVLADDLRPQLQMNNALLPREKKGENSGTCQASNTTREGMGHSLLNFST